jgi:hypothetical protein
MCSIRLQGNDERGLVWCVAGRWRLENHALQRDRRTRITVLHASRSVCRRSCCSISKRMVRDIRRVFAKRWSNTSSASIASHRSIEHANGCKVCRRAIGRRSRCSNGARSMSSMHATRSMRYLIDTSSLSRAIRDDSSRLRRVVLHLGIDQIVVSVMSLFEIEYGLQRRRIARDFARIDELRVLELYNRLGAPPRRSATRSETAA